jgi:hypothetical protein
VASPILAYQLPLPLTIAIITPAWQNPKKLPGYGAHGAVGRRGLLGHRGWTASSSLSAWAIYDAYQPVRHATMRPLERLPRAYFVASAAVHFGIARAYVLFPTTSKCPLFFYIPDAIAYRIGQASDL